MNPLRLRLVMTIVAALSVVSFLLLLLLHWWSGPTEPSPHPLPEARQESRLELSAGDDDPCTVARITDGDTVVCEDERRIRLLGIDAPERAQKPYGAHATEALAELLPVGSRAEVELDVQKKDRYGRTLAYLHTPDGRMANAEMVRRGYALVLTYPPNVRHVDRFRADQEAARRAESGLWATSAWACTPRDFRARRCE